MRSFPAPSGTQTSLRRLSRLAPVIIATAIVGSLLPPAQAVARSSSKRLACHASVSHSRPDQYSTTTVHVKTASHAHVMTSAHYRTTTDTRSARANSRGRAAISYDVSDATEGFRVIVTVRVQRGGRWGDCRTSYVPQ